MCIQSLGNLHGVKDKKKYSFSAFCQSRLSLEDDNLAIAWSALRTNAEIMNNFYFIKVIDF
jgi:hypothetical protein